MPSGLDKTSIFNGALDRLSEGGVLSYDDDVATARWLKRNYDLQRDVLLAQHPWNFAVKRASLATDVTTPAFEWGHQYTVPSDCLRVLPLTVDGLRDSPSIPYVVESLKILTDKVAPLRVRYIRRVTNESDFSPHFADLLAHRLATMMAHWMTGKESLYKALKAEARDILINAQNVDSLEGTPEPPDDYDVLNAR